MGGLGIKSAVRDPATAPVADLIVRELSVEHPFFHLVGVVAAKDQACVVHFGHSVHCLLCLPLFLSLVSRTIRLGMLKKVRFHPMLNVGHFWAPLALDLPQCQEPWRWEEPGRIARNEEHGGTPRQTEMKHKERHWERDKQYCPWFV